MNENIGDSKQYRLFNVISLVWQSFVTENKLYLKDSSNRQINYRRIYKSYKVIATRGVLLCNYNIYI